MKLKKRRKSSRYRGSQTAKRGRKSRTRGSGNQGGKGMAGTGKRADQKKTLVINMTGGNNYFGKDKALRRGPIAPKLSVINLSDISLRASTLPLKDGFINLEGTKILGDGELTAPLNIKASAASQAAIEKMKAAGGTLTLTGKQKETKKAEENHDKNAKRPNL